MRDSQSRRHSAISGIHDLQPALPMELTRPPHLPSYPGPLELFLPSGRLRSRSTAGIAASQSQYHGHDLRSKDSSSLDRLSPTLSPSRDRLRRGAFALHARNFPIVENRRLVVAFPSDKPGGLKNLLFPSRSIASTRLLRKISSMSLVDMFRVQEESRRYTATTPRPIPGRKKPR